MISKGEQLLLEVLDQELPSQPVIKQKPIKVGKKTLYFDFYLPLLKIAFEYDGVQHFRFTEWFHGTLLNFNKSKQNDRDKEEYCNIHKITLMRIPYTIIDKDTMKQEIRRFIKAVAFDSPIYN